MTHIIAVTNHKGGVGKTTTVMNVGSILSDMGKNVLLVDLDAQANLTSSLLKEEQDKTIYSSLRDGAPLPIQKVKENLSLVPSSLELATIELQLSGRMSREYILKNLLQPIGSQYDYILLDCSPSLGLLTINAMAAATELYIPLTAEALPAKGLKMLLDVAKEAKSLNPSLSLSGIIITRYERSNLSQMIEETLRATYGEKVFKTKIRKNISIAEAPLYTQDVLTYEPSSNGAKDYKELTEEILERTREPEYRTEENGQQITIWNESSTIGIRFKKGERLQRYSHEVIAKDSSLASTEKGLKMLNETTDKMIAFAESAYPLEFAPIKTE